MLKAFHDKNKRLPLKREPSELKLHTLYYAIREQVTCYDVSHIKRKAKVALIKEVWPELLNQFGVV
jgi:hypothetical protein